MTTILRALLSALLLSLAIPAFAVYKCAAEGKVSYSDAPCAGGRTIDVDAAPTAGSTAQSRNQLEQQKAELKRLENARYREESHQAELRKAAARASAAREKKCTTLARRKKWASEDAAMAVGKSAEKARRKARRAEETWQDECGS